MGKDDDAQKQRLWLIDFIFVCAVLFLSESSRGVVIPTLNDYVHSLGGTALEVGLIVSIYSAGRLIASFIFGWLSDYYSVRTVLIFSTSACIVGHFMYALADQLKSLWILVASRVLTGFGSGMISVARSFVSMTTPQDERTTWMSYIGIVQFVGFSLTPVLGNIAIDTNILGWNISPYTAASQLLLVCSIASVIALATMMSARIDNGSNDERDHKPPDEHKSPRNNQSTRHSNVTYQTLATDEDVNALHTDDHNHRDNNAPSSWLPIVFVLLNFIGRGVTSVVETYGSPMYYDALYGVSAPISCLSSSNFFFILGIIGVVVFFFIPSIEKAIGDAMALTTSFSVLAVGLIILVDFSGEQPFVEFVLGIVLVWSVAAPINQTLSVSLLSKTLKSSDSSSPSSSSGGIGFWMGSVTAAGSIGRIVFPLISGLLIEYINQNAALVFGAVVSAACVLLCVVALDASWIMQHLRLHQRS